MNKASSVFAAIPQKNKLRNQENEIRYYYIIHLQELKFNDRQRNVIASKESTDIKWKAILGNVDMLGRRFRLTFSG